MLWLFLEVQVICRFNEIDVRWLKDFEVSLRARGCSWNTVSTYLRMLRAVYNRAVDCGEAQYIPHLFRSVYTGTQADRKRALDGDDLKKIFTIIPEVDVTSFKLRRTQELFILMFLLRGLPFVDLIYLHKTDLQGNIIQYRRRKTGRLLSVTLVPEAVAIINRYKDKNSGSPYLFPFLKREKDAEQAYQEYQSALREFNHSLALLGNKLGLQTKISSYSARHTWATTAYYCEIHPGIISEAMGHSSIKVTETYLKPFRNKRIDEANRKILDYVRLSGGLRGI